MTTTKAVTQLLQDWRAGDKNAVHQLAPLVYEELRQVAKRYMRGESQEHTLQPTALVNEAFARLVNVELDWRDRAAEARIYPDALDECRRINRQFYARVRALIDRS